METDNLEGFVALLHRIEDELEIEHFNVHGVNYWLLIRSTIWINYRQSCLSTNSKSFRLIKNDFTYKLSNLIHSFIKGHLLYLFRSRKLKKADILFFGDVSSLRTPSHVQGHYVDNFFDPLIEKLSRIRSVFVVRQNFAFIKPIKGLYDYHIIGCDYLFYSIKSLISNEHRFQSEFLQEYSKLANYQNLKEFVPSLNYLKRHIGMTHSFTTLMSNYIKVIDPKVIFLTHYNSHLSTALIWSARTLGIPVVDVQHGVINQLHPTYSFANQKVHKLNSVPNAFLLCDKFAYNVMAKWVPLDRIHVLSNFRMVSTERSDVEASSFFYSIQKMVCGRKLVLITLSWENGINDLLIDVVNNSRETVYFMFRLHPSTSVIEENKLKKIIRNQIQSNNYHIHCAKDICIDILLEKIDLHVTECSTVVLEALKFRKRSVVISQIGFEYYKDLVQSGTINYATNSRELLNLLNNKKTYRLHPSLPNVDLGHETKVDFDLFITRLENIK